MSFADRIGRTMDALLARPDAAARDTAHAGIVVALSGGPDSTAALLALRPWCAARGRPLAAAHLDHGLRGADSTADADFCGQLCAALDVPLFTHQADPRPVARQRGQGPEEAGRHLRRVFCEGLLASEPDYAWLVTGHHRDDQDETLVMRIFRGTGPDGLRGIRPVAGAWLHPLLGEDRAAIVAFLEEEGQPWRTDATNADGDNTRARMRRELFPVLRGMFGSGCTAGPRRLADLLADDLDLLDRLAAEAAGELATGDGGLDVPGLQRLEAALARRVLRTWLAEGGEPVPELVHVENVRAWLADGTSGGRLDLPRGLTLVREFGTLRRDAAAVPLRRAEDYRIVVGSGPDPADPEARGRSEGSGQRDDPATWNLTCPANVLEGNLQVRNWREGDRMRPLGLDGSKKLSDLLREHRVTRQDREGVLVVADGEGILWVVGMARDERTRLLPDTTRTITLSVVPRHDPEQTKDAT